MISIFTMFLLFSAQLSRAVYIRIPTLIEFSDFDVVFGTQNCTSPQRENAMRRLAFDDYVDFQEYNLTRIYMSAESTAYLPIVVNMSPPTFVSAVPGRSRQLIDFEVKVHELVNVVRLKRKLPPLNANVKLIRSARRHSDDMNLRQFFSTTTKEGLEIIHRLKAQGYDFEVMKYGENVAFGYTDPSAVLAVWMNIPSKFTMFLFVHRLFLIRNISVVTELRDAIINPDYTDLGVGVSTENFRCSQVFGFDPNAA